MKTFLYILLVFIIIGIISSIISPEDTPEPALSPQDSLYQKQREDSIKALPIYTAAQYDSISQQDKKDRIAFASKKLSPLIKNCDDFKKLCFYRHKNNSKYRNSNDFGIYIGESENDYYLRLKIQYFAEDWLFVNSVQVKADTSVFEIPVEAFETDHDGGEIWEWSDTEVDTYLLSILETISQAKTVKIRFNGRQYYKERILSPAKIKALKEVLSIYNSIK
jgi:hypothetical protein